jgi:hypothetical protein
MLPTTGLMDHVTPVFDAPVTVAENCWLCPPNSVMGVDGFNATMSGTEKKTALP